jgi:flavodoxin
MLVVKAFVIYDSVYGNTEEIANALAAGLNSGEVDVEVVKADVVKFDDLNEADLLCVGAPVHACNASSL